MFCFLKIQNFLKNHKFSFFRVKETIIDNPQAPNQSNIKIEEIKEIPNVEKINSLLKQSSDLSYYQEKNNHDYGSRQ